MRSNVNHSIWKEFQVAVHFAGRNPDLPTTPPKKKRHRPSFQRIVWAQAIEVFVTWAQTVVVVRLLGVVGLVAGGVLALDAAQVVA